MAEQEQVRTAADIEAELARIDAVDREPAVSEEDALPEEHNYESEAIRKGWKPKEKFTGDDSKWVDAKTFIERGEKFNVNLQREIASLTKRIEEFEGTKAAFKKFHAETIARKDAELKEVITALRIQRTQAIREGDDELAISLEDQIDEVKQQRQDVKEIPAEQPTRSTEPNPEDPMLQEWIADGNEWFKEDPKLRNYAIALGEDLIKNGETARGRKFLDKVAEMMAQEFPRRFKQAPATARSGVEGGGHAPAGGSKHSVRDLPPEDRALMKQFISEGLTTEEQFLKSYFSSKD